MLLRKGLLSLINNFKSANWYLVFFLSTALVLILIDGFKIEYTRHSQFIQFAWMIYALLAVSIRLGEEEDEDVIPALAGSTEDTCQK